MGQPIKLIQKKGKLRLDGTRLISVQYCLSKNRRVVLSTGIAVPPKFWNKKSRRISPDLPTEFGNVEELEKILTDKVRKAEDMVVHAKKINACPLDFLKTNFPLADSWEIKQMKEDKNELNVYYQIDLYAEERKPEVKQVTINVINEMKAHLQAFEKYRGVPITFDSFDFEFYKTFVRYLTYDYPLKRKKKLVKGLRLNSVGKTIKWLKIFLKDRMAKKIIPYFDISLYKVHEEEVDAIYLSWSEISALYQLRLTDEPILDQVRDLFVLGCLTGFRFSDYSTVQPEEVRNGMLFVTQTKTTDRVVVPLRPEAQAILDKYNMQMPQISNPEFNFHIKEVARRAGLFEKVKFSYKRGNTMIEEIRPKWAWVMSHTCRRSFCTNEFLDGTPVLLIMAISGHKTEKAFRKYIKADNLQKAQMIQKIWANRPGLGQNNYSNQQLNNVA